MTRTDSISMTSRRSTSFTRSGATQRFCAVAELLTRGAGLADRVQVVHGDARRMPFADGEFDLFWTQAMMQNVAEKDRMIAELIRVLAPGGRLALFELVANPGEELEFPVPWADRQAESWLLDAAQLRELLDSGPLTLTTWNEGDAALASIAAAAASLAPPPAQPALGLHMLMPDYQARMEGLARNVAQQKIALVQAVVST